jgi:hypothetical protein
VGRGAVAGWGRWRCGADHPTGGGPSRLVPARQPRVAGPRDGGNGTGHRLAGPDLGPQRWIGGLPIREERRVRLKRDVHRGRGGANLKTPRAGRLGNGGLAVIRTSARLDAARCRGPQVRQDPGIPRALGSFSGRRGSRMETAYPGP